MFLSMGHTTIITVNSICDVANTFHYMARIPINHHIRLDMDFMKMIKLSNFGKFCIETLIISDQYYYLER